jgi:putative transposase
MSRRRHTPEQIVRKLREADRLLSEGSELPEVLKHLEIAEATYHRWRNQYGGMKADDVKRLKELEAENQKLKRIVADQALDLQGLKELSAGRMKVKSAPGCFSVSQRVASQQPCAHRPPGRAQRSGAR